MSYRSLVLGGLALAAAGLPAGLPGVAEAQTFRYSQWIPAGHFTQRDVMHVWFKDIERATDGRVRIQPTAKSLGAPPRQYQLAVDGIADVIWVPHGYTPGVHPLSEAAELPFLTRSTEANSVAYWRVFKRFLEPAGMHKGTHTLAVHVHPAGHLYNNKRDIRAMADFKGIKFRSTTFFVSEALRGFGAVPVAGPVTTLRDGLARGVYDGTSFTDDAIYNFKINKFIKYKTLFPGGLYNTSFMVVMNKGAWDRVSRADQERVMALSGEVYARRIGKAWDAQEAAAAAKVKEEGIVTYELEGDLLARVRGVVGAFEADWVAKVRKLGVDGAAVLRMFRDEVAAYAS